MRGLMKLMILVWMFPRDVGDALCFGFEPCYMRAGTRATRAQSREAWVEAVLS